MADNATDQKVAVVTGGTRGIGLEIGRALVRDLGMRVIAADIMEEAVKALPETFGESAEHAEGRVLDVTDSDAVTKVIDEVAERYGHLNVLVNNAGVTRDGLLLRMSDADWQMLINVNLSGAFYGTRAAAKHMVRQRGGSIINISSYAGVAGNKGQANYSSAKAGLLGLTKTTAKELAAKNVRCNAVAPGFIQTEMTDALPEKAREFALSVVPLKRMGQPSEIADLVSFLASDKSAYITGQVISIDGGLYT